MERNEYKQFMEHIYRRYVTGRTRRRFHPIEWRENWRYEWDRLCKAARRIRTVAETTEEDQEIYDFFRQAELARTVGEVANGIGWTNRFGEETGIWEAIDDFHREIIAGMAVEDMPPAETELLRDLGVSDPDAEIATMIILVKSRRSEIFPDRNEQRILNAILSILDRIGDTPSKSIFPDRNEQRTAVRLNALQTELREQEERMRESRDQDRVPEKKSRRWFKGLGQIAEGTALAMANIALATGALVFNVPEATATWGALVERFVSPL